MCDVGKIRFFFIKKNKKKKSPLVMLKNRENKIFKK